MNEKMNAKTLKIVTTGLMLAVGTVLSIIAVFHMPYGGSITFFSMVPVMLLSYKYGVKWGICSGIIYGVLQCVLGAVGTSNAFAGVTGLSLFGMIFLDYILAFTVLGFAGIFRGKIKNDVLAFGAGAAVAGLLRLVVHFFSGFILWGSYAEWFFTDVLKGSMGQNILQNFSGKGLAAVYSIVYNSSYMIPEILITVVGVIAIMSVKPSRKQILETK